MVVMFEQAPLYWRRTLMVVGMVETAVVVVVATMVAMVRIDVPSDGGAACWCSARCLPAVVHSLAFRPSHPPWRCLCSVR